jgi:hypothetical protein
MKKIQRLLSGICKRYDIVESKLIEVGALKNMEDYQLQQQALSFIQSNMFEQAYGVLSSISDDEKFNLLSVNWYHEEPFHMYTFLLYLLLKENDDKKKAKWHDRCNGYLVGRPLIDDYMCLVDWHLREALRLDPQNIEYMEAVLQEYGHPDSNFSDEEFKYYAKKF